VPINKDTIILGIESSCDETSAAVLKGDVLLSNFIANQSVHERFGGVVPELASRAHQQNIIPVVDQALKSAGVQVGDIGAVAFTRGPGLMGSLLVGVSFAKSFAMARGIPMVEVNHMQAHILAHFIRKPGENYPAPEFPFLCLTVSGGHTQLVLVKSPLEMEIIGETLDDAAGEAFDKSAKLLGLPYPGGPQVDQHAALGDASRFTFPHPQIPEYNFSFSGLKTSILYFLQKEQKKDADFIEKNIHDICAGIQWTIIEILLKKFKKAAREFKVKDIAIAGGVSANKGLRNAITRMGEENNWRVHIPPFEYCTDNAAMIAMAGSFKFAEGIFADQQIAPLARMPF